MDKALLAAEEISKYYKSAFKVIYNEKDKIISEDIKDSFNLRPGNYL